MVYRSSIIHRGSIYLHVATGHLFWIKEISFNNITELKPVWYKVQNMETKKEIFMEPEKIRELINEQKLKYTSWQLP